MRDIFYSIKRFFGKTAKVFRFIPLIWKDEWWSWEYIIDWLDAKLLDVQEGERKKACHETAENDVLVIFLVRQALRRATSEDNYCYYEMHNHKEKWGAIKSNVGLDKKAGEKWTEHDEKRWRYQCNNGKPDDEKIPGLRVKMYYPGAKTPKEEMQASEELMNIMSEQQRQQREDLKWAFETMAEEIMMWWD